MPATGPGGARSRGVVAALAGFVARLPAPLHSALGGAAFLLTYHLLRYRRRVVRDNLARAFPDLDARRRRGIERASYRQLVRLALEIVRGTAMPEAEFVRRVQFRNLALLRRVTDGFSRPAIVLLLHQGNWEWFLHAATVQLPIPVDPVYKPLHSAGWDRLMYESRARFGARPVTLSAVGRDVLRRRRDARLIALVADQSGSRNGYWTDFLHRPASFHRGAGRLPEALQLPVLFARCHCRRPGYYAVDFQTLSLPPHGVGADALLERYVRQAEEAIRAQPESYLWINRRWKKRPPNADA